MANNITEVLYEIQKLTRDNLKILDAINEKIMPLKDYKPTTNCTPVEQMRKAKMGV